LKFRRLRIVVLAQERGIASAGPRFLCRSKRRGKSGRSISTSKLGITFLIGGAPRYTLLDLGGRYRLSRGLNALFMAGRSVTGIGGGGPTFNGYFGIQILLKDHGRSLAAE
jgi:hypothetical protein